MFRLIRSAGSASALAAALTLSAMPAVADDHAGGMAVSGNVSIASDYRFRGVSQTTRDPAIQGGFDVEFDGGFYLGTWASNVNFGDSTSMEWDFYGGFAGELDNGVGYDVFYIRYEYPSEGDALDYNEIGVALSFGDFTGGVIYSNEYLALDDVSWFYPYVDYSRSLGENLSLDVHVGWSLADDNSAGDFEGIFGDEDYLDWSIGLSTSAGGVDIGLAYVDTDIDEDVGGDAADSTVVLSISKSL